jgi:hypothetical protein
MLDSVVVRVAPVLVLGCYLGNHDDFTGLKAILCLLKHCCRPTMLLGMVG